MRPLMILPVVTILAMGAAMAQNASATLSASEACPPGSTSTTSTSVTESGIIVSEGTTTMLAGCPPTAYVLPGQCPMLVGTSLTGETMVLVLGTEESSVLGSVPATVNWSNASLGYVSLFERGNPLTFSRPNPVVLRHGNPFYPYYRINSRVSVAGYQERVVRFPSNLNADSRNTLVTVANQYRTLTTTQAMAMGYQPIGTTCIEGYGMVYVNQSMVDATIDPMKPEAFSFAANGRVLAAHYISQGAQRMSIFGQNTMDSPFVTGSQQVTVWLFEPNRNGLFAMQNPSPVCSVAGGTAMTEGTGVCAPVTTSGGTVRRVCP
ncbi:MAG: hypothetical protein ACYDBB_14800 [Armatimonadota bacterium]